MVMMPRSRLRRGYTTLELVVNLASASVLLMGLASTVYISTFAFSDVHESRALSGAAEVQADMMADLQCATSFISANADEITFTVPDRNGDGVEETISYFESNSPEGRLMYSMNGAPAGVLLDNLEECRFRYLSRTIAGQD